MRGHLPIASILGGLLGFLLGSCGTDLPPPSTWKYQLTDEEGIPLAGARVEFSSYGNPSWILVADAHGRAEVGDLHDHWSLEVRSVDGCPYVIGSTTPNQSGGGDVHIVRSREILRRCRDTIDYGVRGTPGAQVGWSLRLRKDELDEGLRWSATLRDTTTLDERGRGRIRIPSLLSPFQELPEFRLLVRGVAFPLGAWWIDPTDSVFTILPIRFSQTARPRDALSVKHVSDRDSIFLSDLPDGTFLEWWRRGGPLIRRGKVQGFDSTLAGRWGDSAAASFRWSVHYISGSDRGIAVDTGAGIERGLWLRPPP